MAVRSKFSSRSQAALQLPSQPPSADAAAWCEDLGIGGATLQQWGAGMATMLHPVLKQQVEVLALPYMRSGHLVDMRCLHLEHGQLLGSWLAVGAKELYMREQELQGASTVVFVSCELDALVLSAAGYPAIAVAQQAPIWLTPGSTLQQQQQQQVPQQPLQQVLLLRQQQQASHQQPPPQQQLPHHQQQQQQRRVPEDPRLRLSGLTAELDRLRRQQEVGAARKQTSSSSSNASDFATEGLVVSDVSRAPLSGLSLLLPSASIAVIAMAQGPEWGCSSVVGNELAGLLGEVHCRHVQWPDTSPAGTAEAAAAAPAAAAYATQQQLDEQQQAVAIQQQQQWHASLQQALLADPAMPQGAGWDMVLLGVLQGPEGVAAAVEGAYVWPIVGLERFSDHALDLLAYFLTPSMDHIAVSTGWPSLDEYYKVAPGEVTLVTGVPNSGKSEWLDALAVNLAEQQGWRFAVCSMEKRPRDHARQLLEKVARRPLLSAAYAGGLPRMTPQELDLAYEWLCQHFFVIASGEDRMPSIAWVLEKAKAAKIQFGINGLIIDPYNELDPSRSPSMKEHEHINELMGLLRRFARDNAVHCWLVAHPRQMAGNWSGQRPGLQDVSGGANFMNKTDNGIIVHRNWSKLEEMQQRAAAAAGVRAGGGRKPARPRAVSSNCDGRGTEGAAVAVEQPVMGGDEQQQALQQALHIAEYEVQVIVEKVRNKTTGSRGECKLVYDRATGRYHEPEEQPDRVGLLEQVAVLTDSPGSLEVVDLPAGGNGHHQQQQDPYAAQQQQQQQNDEDVLQERRELAQW